MKKFVTFYFSSFLFFNGFAASSLTCHDPYQQIVVIQKIVPLLKKLESDVARTQGFLPHFKYLLQGFANLIDPNFNGEMPSLFATRDFHIDLLSLLLVKVGVYGSPNESIKILTPAWYESSSGYRSRIHQLISNLTIQESRCIKQLVSKSKSCNFSNKGSNNFLA